MNYHKLLSSLLTILISFSLHAQTADAFETVETNEVPEAVINGLKKQIDQSKEQLSEWRYDLSTFEAKVENKDATTYYRFNPEGRFLEKRTLLNWGKNAPVKLRNTKAKSYFKDSEVEEFYKAKIFFAPGKASNAGGVATSGLEMSQNSMRYNWTAEDVDKKLQQIMKDIHHACVTHGVEHKGFVDYVRGANIAGFVKVADAMIAQGVV